MMKKDKIKFLFENQPAKVITANNFKGGVGKTTLNSMLAYIATEKYDLRVLLFDSDPQANLTKKTRKTYKNITSEANTNIVEGISNFDIRDSVTIVNDNLSIVEGLWDMAHFSTFINTNISKKDNSHYRLYQSLIEPLKSEYDLILFDGIPTTGDITNNCIIASDYVIVPTQTEEDAYDNTLSYINYLITMTEYNPDLEIIGIVPYLVSSNDKVDKDTLLKYQNEFPEITFNNIIKRSARVKSWSTNGITENQPYDKRTLEMYTKVFDEMIERIYNIEG
uniref:ParA family protein n=1 Tax=Carnobacterium sp. TaxID=48221 RepID=UPI00344B253F